MVFTIRRELIHLKHLVAACVFSALFLSGCKSSEADFSAPLVSEPSDGQEETNGIDLDRSFVTASPTSLSADGISTSTLTFVSRDIYGNIYPVGGANIEFIASAGLVTGAVTDFGNGIYTQTLQSPISLANTQSPITVTANVNTEPLTSSPVSIAMVSGSVSLSLSSVETTDASLRANGTSTTLIRVTLRNSLGNQLSVGGQALTIQTTAGTLLGSVTDVGDGTYTQTIRSPAVAQSATISAKIGNANLGDTANLVFNPPPSYFELVFTGQPSTTSASLVAFASQPIVTIKDNFGNTVTSGPDATSLITLSLGSGTGTLRGTVSMNAVAGVANFAGKGLNLDLVGAKVLTATKEDLLPFGGTGVLTRNSNSLTITSGVDSQIIFSTQPGGGAAGALWAVQPVAHIVDSVGNLVTTSPDNSAPVTLTVSSGSLVGTTTVNANGSGVVTFTGLSMTQAGTYTLTATKANTTGNGGTVAATVQSSSFSIVPGPDNTLSWVTQPSTTAATASMSPIPKLRVYDAYGNLSTGSAAVTLAILNNPSSGTPTGGGPVNVVNGEVSFPGFSIDRLGTGYTLQATAPTLVNTSSPVSTSFSIIPTTPANFVALGGPATPATVSLSWTASVGSGALTYSIFRGTTSGGQSLTPIVSGLTATTYVDSGLTNIQPYYYYIVAEGGGLTSARSSEVTATPYAAPSAPRTLTAVTNGATISLNWLVPTGTYGSLTYNVYRGTTSNGQSATPIATGVVGTTWIDNATNNPTNPPAIDTRYYYKLRAVGVGGTGFLSNEANARTYGPATKLVFTTSPSHTQGRLSLSPQAVVQVQSAGSVLVANSTILVTLAIGSNPSGGTLSGTKTVAAVGGVATFPGLTIDQLGSGYTLTANAGGLSQGVSSSFNILGKTLQVPIEMVQNSLASQTSISNYTQSSTTLSTTYYDGSPTYQFEVVFVNNDGSARNVYLRSINAGTDVATISLPAGTSSYTYKSSSDFTPSGASHRYVVRIDGTSSASDVEVASARIIVTQTNATKTAVYVPLLAGNGTGTIVDSTTITPGSGLVNGIQQNPLKYPIWNYNLSTWGQAPSSYFFEAVASNDTGGMTTNVMFETYGGATPLRTLSVTSTSPTYTSNTFSGLTDGTSYAVYMHCSGGTAEIYKAGMYIILDPIRSGEVYYRLSGQQTYSTNNNTSQMRAYVDLSKFPSTIPEAYMDFVGYMSSSLSTSVQLQSVNATSGAASPTSINRIISSAVSPAISTTRSLVRQAIDIGGGSGMDNTSPRYYITNTSASGPSLFVTQELLVIPF